MLTLAYVHRSDEADQLVAAFATDDDRRASERYLRLSRRRQALTSRALLRSTLAELFGPSAGSWELGYCGDGKPTVKTGDGREGVQISISHSRDLVACAVTDIGPIGIDVEHLETGRPFTKIAATAFGDQEGHAAAAGGPSAFYKIWTLREALAKASGLGFPHEARRTDLFGGAPTGEIWRSHVAEEHWAFYHQELLGSYALSVALKSGVSVLAETELAKACALLARPVRSTTDELYRG